MFIIWINRYFLTWMFGSGAIIFLLSQLMGESDTTYVVGGICSVVIAVLCIMWWLRDKRIRDAKEAAIVSEIERNAVDAERWRQNQAGLAPEQQADYNLAPQAENSHAQPNGSAALAAAVQSASSNSFCPECGRAGDANSRFCSDCGAELLR